MTKLLALLTVAIAPLCAWDDHPDRDESRLDNAFDSQNFVESGYDWSKMDRDSGKDSSSTTDGPRNGTILDQPDRDK